MSPSLVAEYEGARQSCFTKSAEEPICTGGVAGFILTLSSKTSGASIPTPGATINVSMLKRPMKI